MKVFFISTLFALTLTSYSQVDSSIYCSDYNEDEMGWNIDKGPLPIVGIDSFKIWIDKNNRLMNVSDPLTKKQFVYVEFWVGTNGDLKRICVIRGIGNPYDKEAYRLISECPIRWLAGESHNRKIELPVTIPINFNEK